LRSRVGARGDADMSAGGDGKKTPPSAAAMAALGGRFAGLPVSNATSVRLLSVAMTFD
jgi:hypothetical protein